MEFFYCECKYAIKHIYGEFQFKCKALSLPQNSTAQHRIILYTLIIIKHKQDEL
jgi:hypothetical protein